MSHAHLYLDHLGPHPAMHWFQTLEKAEIIQTTSIVLQAKMGSPQWLEHHHHDHN